MRSIFIALAALAMITAATPLSTAQADNWWGPKRVGDKCWKKTLGNSLGYWEDCKDKDARAASTRSGKRRN